MRIALLVVDFINDIVHQDGKIAAAAREVAERDVIAAANHAIAHARAANWLPVFVKVGFEPSYASQPKSSPIFGRAQEIGALQLDGWGTAFHKDLTVLEDDLVLTKPRVSSFYGTRLEAVLRANAIEHLILAGVSTAWAIQSTAREGHDRDYQITILQDACAAATQDEHQQSLQTMSRIARITEVAGLDRA
ncbi:MAG: isochorismatase family cysteine hydrolase [Pseudomonadota bacterium]